MSSESGSDQRRQTTKQNWQKTIRAQGQQHKLLRQILKVLSKSEVNHHNISSYKFNSIIPLKIIEKKPLFVADSTTCIQALIKPQQLKIARNPFNNYVSDYYNTHSKPHIVFNCFDQVVDSQENDDLRFPSAYHPAYHYKRHYEQFKQKRKTTQVLVSCEVIQVKSWSLEIVNISCSGYYAPILIIHEFKRKGENVVMQSPVQNILFYKELTPFLEKYRVEDMRKVIPDRQASEVRFSFFMRNQVTLKKNVKISQFASLDSKGSLLTNNPNMPINFIPLGNIKQYEIFKRPVPPKFVSKREKINLQKFNLINKGQQENRNEGYSSEQYEHSLQDETPAHRNQQQNDFVEEMENRRNSNQMQDQYSIGEDSQDNSEEDNYLKKCYQKRLKQNKQTLI